MKILNGSELRDFIKERQAKQVRALRQSWKVFPKLIILYSSQSPVIETYMRLKQQYGEDILIDVEKKYVPFSGLEAAIKEANEDELIHGIIVQLPIEDSVGNVVSNDDILPIIDQIDPKKDVDGLTNGSLNSATATAINWLLAGYNVNLQGKKIAIIGQGILVGLPLAKIWQTSGYDVTVFDINSSDEMRSKLSDFDIVVTATGSPGLIKSDMLKQKAVVVDAGTASEGGKIKGDVDDSVRESRNDLTITPKIGGVGPLTIAALMESWPQPAQSVDIRPS